MFRRSRKKSRFETDAAFRDYLEECWPEHFRRISESRRAAPFVKVYYPLLGFLFSSILAGGFTLVVAVLARQEVLPLGRLGPSETWLRESLTRAVPAMWGITVVVIVMTVLACIAAGIARARALVFEAEKLEMQARLEHALWHLRTGHREGDPFETLASKGPAPARAPEETAPAAPVPPTSSAAELDVDLRS